MAREKYFDDIFDNRIKKSFAWLCLLSTSIVINAPQLQAVFLIVQPVNDDCKDPDLPVWEENLITEFNLTCDRQKYIRRVFKASLSLGLGS